MLQWRGFTSMVDGGVGTGKMMLIDLSYEQL
jgi:predicted ATPase